MMDALDVRKKRRLHRKDVKSVNKITKICIKNVKEPNRLLFCLEGRKLHVEGIVKWIPIGIGVLSVFVQVSPIKINPISWLGSMFMQNTNQKIDELEHTIDTNEIENLRRSILDFANSCQNGIEHSQEQFNQVFKDNEKYHCLLKKYNLTNGRVDSDFKYIENTYQDCLKKHHFKGGK
jgi:hypothetical protein